MEIDNQNIPEIQDEVITTEELVLSEDQLAPEEVMVEVTNAELYAEVSAKAGVSEDTVKTILNALITHQIATMNI